MPGLPDLTVPVLVAPMAGGPSTPGLVAAVANCGGSGFLAAGYRTAEQMQQQIDATRALTDRPFGVNLFVPNDDQIDEQAVHEYRRALMPLAAEYGLDDLPTVRADADDWDAKLAVLQSDPVSTVSFTFGLPDADVVMPLQAAGMCVIATVTSVAEASEAAAVGYDALVVQGPEAGGHRGTHATSTTPGRTPLRQLLTEVAQSVDLPLIAAGGLSNEAAVAGVLDQAVAAQVGTAYLLADEAGTSATHRAALRDPQFTSTTVTRCFTGRAARALHNDFIERFDPIAPAAYPALHQISAPLRRAAADRGDAQLVHLWAGTGWRTIGPGSAADITGALWVGTP